MWYIYIYIYIYIYKSSINDRVREKTETVRECLIDLNGSVRVDILRRPVFQL